MSDTADMPVETIAPSRPAGREQQRFALRDLVSLASECATREAQLNGQQKESRAAADLELKRSGVDFEKQAASARTEILQKFEARRAELRTNFDAEMTSIKDLDTGTRQRIELDHESVEQDIQQRLDQAIWLAESVYEGVQQACKTEKLKAEEEHQAFDEACGEMQNKTLALLQLYGVQPATVTHTTPAVAENEDAEAAFNRHRAEVDRLLKKLDVLAIPRLFVGIRPAIVLFVWCVLAVIASRAVPATVASPIAAGAGALVAAVVIAVIAGFALKFAGMKQAQRTYLPLQAHLDDASEAAQQRLEAKIAEIDAKDHRAHRQCELEVLAAKQRYEPALEKNAARRDETTKTAESDFNRRKSRLEAQRDKVLAELTQWRDDNLKDLQARYDRDMGVAKVRHRKQSERADQDYFVARHELETHWSEGLSGIQAPIENQSGQRLQPWEDPSWEQWEPPRTFAASVRFGQLAVDLRQVLQNVAGSELSKSTLPLPEQFTLPALLTFPQHASVLIQHDRNGRDTALRTLQMLMARVLTSLPPGRAKFTLIDPVGLGQNFAGFMHLADYDESLVGGRIWTNPDHIDQRLRDLTEHMETVIQKYLRNEFETIDDYNAQAGELAEPYRFLVIADFPVSFQGDAFQRLSSIASTGARCGVYTLMSRDLRVTMPPGTHIDELEKHSVNLVQDGPSGEKFIWKDEVFKPFPLTLDAPAGENLLTQMMHKVGRRARENNRVEVPFDSIAPDPEEFWSLKANDEIRVPIGRMGATRLQNFRLGKGVAQHALVAGKTGSGKSTLLHALVTNMAMWYSPDEVEFYLIDFKKGVEFKTYATHSLPHARAIAVESDREFGISVLQRIDAELTRRGELYRKVGVQDIASYRRTTGERMPRTLLIIDEFQEFFSDDDKLAQEAALLLDRLVRQGRAFGIHVLLGSQTIGGSSGLARTTLGQIAVRIALQTSEADSQLILGDNNSAARLLGRPGEAIYNDQGGLVEGNSPFQVAWLPDERREVYLEKVRNRADLEHAGAEPPIVFEGNAPADVTKNRALMTALKNPVRAEQLAVPIAWIGEPVAIKQPTSVSFRRQSGANMLIIGQQDDSAMSIVASSIISLSAQHAAGTAKFYIFDGTPADSPLAGSFEAIKQSIPHEMTLVNWRSVDETFSELSNELKRRQADADAQPPAVYVIVFGMQRYRQLRRSEDSFSFSAGDEEKPATADKVFADLLKEGAPLGMHIIAWVDTPVNVDRTLDRGMMREFDHRILFQMSAADSSNLIDSPAANKLGFFRALAYSEEQGVMEKFRPYAVPGKQWLATVKGNFEKK